MHGRNFWKTGDPPREEVLAICTKNKLVGVGFIGEDSTIWSTSDKNMDGLTLDQIEYWAILPPPPNE